VTDALQWLQRWFIDHCDGDWEHTYSIHIETLDNPGWHVSIDIRDTELDDRPAMEQRQDRTPADWLHVFVRDGKFEVYCGAGNLVEALGIFRRWAESPDTLPDGPPSSPHSVD
jgi:hypothetical protein